MRIALAQINTIVGDLKGNADWIGEAIADAASANADLVLLPELAITGYPPEDLLLRPAFLRDARRTLEQLAAKTQGLTAIIGLPAFCGGDLYNSAAVVSDGQIKAMYRKRYLPNYGVFDEDRYFASGNDLVLLRLGDTLLGLTICEDIWQPGAPATDLALAGAEVILNVSASPFHIGKGGQREEMLAVRARDNGCFVVYANAVGGQDELVFDGQSLVLDPNGEVIARGAAFSEELVVVDIDAESARTQRLRDPRPRALARINGVPQATVVDIGVEKTQSAPLSKRPDVRPACAYEEMAAAVILGLRDYIIKNGFRGVVLGMSGGIDSALCAALAVEALGAENVHAVSMPSRFSSDGTKSDARRQSEILGIDFQEIPIEQIAGGFETALAPAFAGTERNVAEENIQARIRGTLLMALSNKFGWLLLTTGNKSETSVGYATLYGDMAGGFAPIKDLYKTDVFGLCRYLNERAGKEVVLTSIIDRPPSAELSENQKDQDFLPPYDVLDDILKQYVEGDQSVSDMAAAGYDEELVGRIARLVDHAEYKRRQAPPGVKLHPKAFGRDRRLPITNRWFG